MNVNLKLKKEYILPDLTPKDFVNQFKFGNVMSTIIKQETPKIITKTHVFLRMM